MALHALPPRSDEKFFIYDWPEVCSKLKCEALPNYGAGKSVNASNGIYNTNQFHLFNLMYSRALKDPRRTLNPEEATTFFIPYDAYVDSMRFEKGVSRIEWSPDDGDLRQGAKVHDLLQASPYFHRNQGKDHFMVIAYNSAFTSVIIKRSSIPLYQLCSNCTKLAIEDLTFLYNREDNIAEVQNEGQKW